MLLIQYYLPDNIVFASLHQTYALIALSNPYNILANPTDSLYYPLYSWLHNCQDIHHDLYNKS